MTEPENPMENDYDPGHKERNLQRAQRKMIAQDAKNFDLGLEQTLSTFVGRRFIWLFLSDLSVFHNPFHPDPQKTAFECGRQSAGQQLLARITETNPEAFLLMMKENKDARTERTAVVDRLSADE